MCRTAWTAADGIGGRAGCAGEPDRGSGADEGIRPTAEFEYPGMLKVTCQAMLKSSLKP
jgi:hypothetical protein